MARRAPKKQARRNGGGGTPGWIWLLIGLLALPTALHATFEASGTDRTLGGGAAFLQALTCWGFVLGLIGLFQRTASRPRPWVRLVSDSSYWVYLMHLPLVFVLQALARNLFSDHVFAFEFTSILLIVAVAGTALLTRKDNRGTPS